MNWRCREEASTTPQNRRTAAGVAIHRRYRSEDDAVRSLPSPSRSRHHSACHLTVAVPPPPLPIGPRGKGYLDEQFAELHKLADESDPGFVIETISIFFNDSDRILHNLTTALLDLDLNQAADIVQMLKGSSLSVGAKKVKDACIANKKTAMSKTSKGSQLEGMGRSGS